MRRAAMVLAGLLAPAFAGAVEVPRPKPDPPAALADGAAARPTASLPAGAAPVPVPAPRPVDAAAAAVAADGLASTVAGSAMPVPRARPSPPSAVRPAAAPTAVRPDPAGPRGSPRACRRALRDLGVAFERNPPIREGACGARRPVRVSAVGGVPLSTPATLRCPAAVAFARWVREVVEPAAQRHLGGRLAGFRVAASYHCRTRRNGRGSNRLSEHALANAIDISAVALDNGNVVEVRPWRARSREGRFQAAIREGGCGLFKTVLGPGSDGLHENHLHFDLADRRNGSTYCR